MTPRARIAIVVIAVAGLAAAFVAASGSDDEDGGTTPAVTTAPVPTTTAAATTPTATTEAEPPLPTVRVRDGKVVGGVPTLEHRKGDAVDFRVRSDVADHVHVHGYDIMRDVKADGSVRVRFKAALEGRFEVELEDAGVEIARLEVNP